MSKKQNLEPIQQSVFVDCRIDDAFQLFTERFSEWWPLAAHSMSGEQAETCEIEPWAGGRVFERTRSGEEIEWGSVTTWDPPRHLEFTWHDQGSTVDVEFNVEADGTRVTVIHTGWEAKGVSACALHFSNYVAERALVAV